MRSRGDSFTLIGTLLGLAVLIAAPAAGGTPKYQVLHAFGSGQDGTGTWGSLILDGEGNIFGTTSGGGLHGFGTVFELRPKSSGKWSESILYSFNRNGQDGYLSTAAVVLDTAGNLYGTTQSGGTRDDGTVFELTPGSSGWTETVLFSFDLSDGCCPYGSLVIDSSGNLYGTGGVAFELAPGLGGYAERVIHRFAHQHGDGYDPFAGMILDGKGNLYGTTKYGGTQNTGIVYRLQPTADGGWKERILHNFGSIPNDGGDPGLGALARDDSGNLYGVTAGGGTNWCGFGSCGTVYKLAPQQDGHWKETVLYNFKAGPTGFIPGAGVARDAGRKFIRDHRLWRQFAVRVWRGVQARAAEERHLEIHGPAHLHGL